MLAVAVLSDEEVAINTSPITIAKFSIFISKSSAEGDDDSTYKHIKTDYNQAGIVQLISNAGLVPIILWKQPIILLSNAQNLANYYTQNYVHKINQHYAQQLTILLEYLELPGLSIW